MTRNYYDYLVDCTLMIGANEFSGLILPQKTSSSDNSFQSIKYQQQIIAAISSTVAMFPFTSAKYDYPPEEFRKSNEPIDLNTSKHVLKTQISKTELQAIQNLVIQYNKNEVLDLSIVPQMNSRNSKYHSRRRSMKMVSLDDLSGSWGSVSIETIKSFPATYFNNNLTVSSKYLDPEIKIIPLTDNMGNRSFALGFEFHRKFAIIKENENDKKEIVTLRLRVVDKDNEEISEIVYVPNNIIFFSKYPYFDLFRDIISHLFRRIENTKTGNIEKELMEFSSILTRIPILKSENLKINFSIYDAVFSIERSIPISSDIIDWDLTLLFQILSLDDIISILMALFQEQKLVFLANNSNTITVCTETILLLFRPFLWKHFYLTTTPVHLYELIDAIFPFILGLPHSIKHKIVDYYPDIIIVDLEEGRVFIPESCKLKYVSQHLIKQLKQGVQKRDLVRSIQLIHSLNPLSFEEFNKLVSKLNMEFSRKILNLFMNFMVDLFQEIIRHTAVERSGSEFIVVNLDRFLKTSSSPNIQFFKEIYETDNFKCFIDDKLRKGKVDGWVRICSYRYPELVRLSKRKVSFKFGTVSNNNENKEMDVDLANILEKEDLFQEIMLQTSKNNRPNYHKNLINNLNNQKQSIDIMKLKAEVLLNSGYVLQSLEEFYKILILDPLELNHSKLRKILREMNKTTLEKLKTLKFHQNFFDIISFDERRLTISQPYDKHYVEQFNPPTVPISKNNFLEVCCEADIAEYEIAINSLFSCLTIDTKSTKSRNKTVNPDIFRCFYNNWISSSMDLCDLKMPLESEIEVLIKGSETCLKVDGYGLGRVILTQLRLIFIPFGNNYCSTIVNFKNEDLIKIKLERKIKGFGKMAEVLELVIKERDSKVLIWVTHDSDKWHQLINEINFVNKLTEEEKDISLISIMTEQCLMFENIITCGKMNSFFKNHLNEMGKKLLPYTNEKNKTKKHRIDNNRQYLLTKLMPSPKQTVTIDSVIEISQPLLDNFDIWCACTSLDKYFINVFQIIDRNVYKVQENKINIPLRVQTLMRIPRTNKIIVCCISHIVLILDLNTQLIEKEFPLDIDKGSYPICCLTSDNGCHLVYFGTNNGEIVSWDFKTNKTRNIIRLAMNEHISSIHQYDANTLIVGSLYKFYIMSTEGNIINIIIISELLNVMTKTSYLTLINNNKTVIVGLARLPVFLEYDLSDIKNVSCQRKINVLTKKVFNLKDISEHYELSPSYVGIASILVTEETEQGKHFWIMFKDGTIEIMHYETMENVAKFNAHIDVINKGLLCKLKDEQIVISVGRTDGKVNLWSLHPLV